ncbi:MAG TPA: FtsH protease activity modulator HflK [Pirellulales bacterium]|nr:FtsH protease activity modulator HflK [Pirellulales bacterium]
MRRAAVLGGIALLAWLATGVYVVQPDEQALVRRFGRAGEPPGEPGAHFGLPWGLDFVHRLKPREVKRVAIGGAADMATGVSPTRPLFLTGDRNLVTVSATVHYTIGDPRGYLFRTAKVDRLVATAATAAVTQILSSEPVDRVLTLGKHDLGVRLAQSLQTTIDPYEVGVVIRSVDIAAIEPPAEVADAFDQVVGALRERERTIHQAESFANRTAAEAQGGAERVVDQGRADRDRTLRRAQGEAERFNSLLAEYRRSPKLTAGRLYLEAMAQTLPKLKAKLIVDSSTEVDLSIMREDGR